MPSISNTQKLPPSSANTAARRVNNWKLKDQPRDTKQEKRSHIERDRVIQTWPKLSSVWTDWLIAQCRRVSQCWDVGRVRGRFWAMPNGIGAREHLLECNCEDFIQLKGYRNNPLGEEDKKRNKQRSRIRVRVELVFGRVSQLAMGRLRTIGKDRAHHYIGLSNLLYNMDQCAFLMKWSWKEKQNSCQRWLIEEKTRLNRIK